jgi:hypothetical protein
MKTLTAVAASMCLCLLTADAFGQTVIESGRESEILALFTPYALASDVVENWQLRHVSIQTRTVDCQLVGPAGAHAVLRLAHPERAPKGAEKSGSFWLRRMDSSGKGEAALAALAAAVHANDAGRFWERVAVLPVATKRIRLGGEWGHWRALLQELGRDGLLWVALALIFLVLAARRTLRGAETHVAVALVAIVGVGLLARLALSPHSPLGAWIFSRDMQLTHHVWRGPLLFAFATGMETSIGKFDVMSGLNMVSAVATPIVVFIHGRLLLGSLRLGLVAAGLVAVLPIHVRFAASEVSFVPSILLSSLLFAVVHMAMRERSRAWRWSAWAALVPLIAGVLIVRPLNYGFIPLLVFVVWFLVPAEVSRRSRQVMTAVLVSVSGFLFFTQFVGMYGHNIEEGSSVSVLLRGVFALFSPTDNTLIHPWVTPPVFLLLAVIGGIVSWRSGRKMLVGFLLAWLLGFFLTHAYVLPGNVAMQARYHLHLVVPSVFLAALGLEVLWDRRPRLAWGAGILLLFSPVIHADFIQDLDFNELREHAFIAEQAPAIPDGCTIYEYVGGLGEQESRFRRAGLVLSERGREQRFRLRPIAAPDPSDALLSAELREELRDPPTCAYLYEGLPCWSEKELGAPIAPVCSALRDAVPSEQVAEVRFPSRVYDPSLSRGFRHQALELRFSLHRIVQQTK